VLGLEAKLEVGGFQEGRVVVEKEKFDDFSESRGYGDAAKLIAFGSRGVGGDRFGQRDNGRKAK
jgi:hypothetical protein